MWGKHVVGIKEENFNGEKFNLIYADPPWQYKNKKTGGSMKSGASQKYDTMTIEDLMKMDVGSIAADNCLLAMWHVAPMPQEALDLVKAWGFTIKTTKGFTWHKLTTKNGLSNFGMGHYTRANTEDCLFAIKGKFKRASASVRQFVEAKIGEHSAKPDEVRDRLVQLVGDVKRVELFARNKCVGWQSWGNEL